ncbi:MAG: S1-like domain-containing RNA-binding protein [Myxococcales bacterium]|nr:S1-like domain-containing RNA-binding protein [Myxococcales bacterium]
MTEPIQIGRYNTLKIMRSAPPGLYLGSEEEQVLLPSRYVPEGAAIGEALRVFVYTDSEDRPIATTLEPAAVVGDFALLEVVDLSEHGAFLDWGLDKDLFAPFGEQHQRLRIGDRRVFAVCSDERTGRVHASSQLRTHLDYDVSGIEVGAEVSLLVYDPHELGALVVVEGKHAGLVYRTETFQPLSVGDSLKGYVKRVRDDNKLDIGLQRQGVDAIDDAQRRLLEALRASGGRLRLHDKSPPEEIRATLRLSKKAFKRALGALYKARRVRLLDDGIELLEGEPGGPG